MNTKVKKCGFTLIELLVVIAIIMILAAILFPVFERAQSNAERASCQSNLKQVALSFKQYVQDNDGRYPFAFKSFGGTRYGVWVSNIYVAPSEPVLDPYLKSSQILRCPTSEVPEYSVAYTTYAMNGIINGTAEAVIESPALTILNWEHDPNPSGGNGCGRRHYQPWGPRSINGVNVAAIHSDGCEFPAPDDDNERHLDGSNFSFVDGHVKWYAPSVIKATPTGSEPKFEIS